VDNLADRPKASTSSLTLVIGGSCALHSASRLGKRYQTRDATASTPELTSQTWSRDLDELRRPRR
jgi:hypothetical protein